METNTLPIRDELGESEYLRLAAESYELLRRREYREARDLLRRLVRLSPCGHEVWFYLGVAEARLGDKGAAVAAFEAALLNKPGDEETCVRLARLELRRLRWKAAWRHLRCAVRAATRAAADADGGTARR